MKTPKTAEEIAEKYVRGSHDALTDNQEIKDMAGDIEEYAEQARRKERERLIDVLHETRLQIEYLHGKFAETGSGNAVIAKIDLALAAAGYGKEES